MGCDRGEGEGAGEGLGLLDSFFGYHLRRASGVFGSDFSRAVEGSGLRQVPFAILSVVDANPGINQGAAGRMLGIKRANMVALINELVDAGYIDRRQAEDDRRAFSLTVTKLGKEVLDRCARQIALQEAVLLGDFSTAERATLLKLIRRIEANERPIGD